MKLSLYITFSFFFSFLLWAEPERITVIIDNNYPPYSFPDENGNLQGISIDLWREWERHTGIRAVITGVKWSEAQARMEAGEFDVIDTMFYTEERSKKYEFSKPYARIDVVIFFESSISGINDVISLRGLMVGVKKGDADIDFLRKNGVEYLAEFDNYEDVVVAAKNGRIKIFVIDKPPGIYYLLKHKAENDFRFSDPLYYGEFHRAYRKGNTDIFRIVEGGFGKIPAEKLAAINEKWLGKPIIGKGYTKILKILLFALSTLLVLLLMTYLWVFSLRRAVRERTMLLNIEKERAENFAKELLKSEKRFVNLYNNISDIIYTIRLDGQMLEINPKGLMKIGYSATELKNLRMEDLVLPEDLEKAREGMRSRLKGDDSPKEFRIRTRSGEVLTLETRGTLLYENDKPYAIQAIARDITQQRLMEERLLESQKLEALGLLAGGIAHDFNNILMGIINYIEFIKKDYGNKDLFMSDINHLRNSADRAARLVQQLLGFSRKQMILPQPLNINELILGFQNSLFKFLGENIKIMFSLSERNPVIFADKSQIEQILMNIVVNSKDAMPNGGRITITTNIVRLENEAEGNRLYNGDFVLVSVRDTGCGISEENLKKVFEPFFTTKPVGKGTGLGLSMVYGAMQQNNGFVRIASKPNSGTEVRLYFPLSDKVCDEKISLKPLGTYSGNFATILLVEDDDEVRSVIRQILNAHNFNVIEAKDAEEALREFEINSDLIRLIISDIIMPDKTGVELKNIISAKYKDVRFLFITGYSEEVLLSKGIETGKTEILYKPFNSERILSAIGKILGPEIKPV